MEERRCRRDITEGQKFEEKGEAGKEKLSINTTTISPVSLFVEPPFSKGAFQPGGWIERSFTSTPTSPSLPLSSLLCVSLECSFSS